MFDKFNLKSLLIVIILLLTFGCKPNDFENFQNQAIEFAQNDNKINEEEYNALSQIILTSADSRLIQFKKSDQEVDHQKVVQYLVKFLKTKEISLAEDNIAIPGKLPETPFNVNVYIENSASMDGYVKGVTGFETAIYNLLGDFKISDQTKSLNLNYINSKITYTKQDALPADIQDFIEKLEPSTFKQRGGDRGVSDIKNILSTVLDQVNNENLVVLVSDFVFSPGKNVNAQDYLNNQTVGIKLDFAKKLKEFDLAAVIIQMESEFNGSYYDRFDNPIPLSNKRPYYIWILGSSSQIKSIINKKFLDNIKGGYKNRIILSSLKEPLPVDYKILLSNKIGDFRLSEGSKGPITEAEVSKRAEKKDLFGFEVAVDFSKNPQDKSYFSDPTNYRVNGNYSLSAEPIVESDQTTQGFTHKLMLVTKELRDENLKIEVIGKLPKWVETSSSIDDTNIGSDKSEISKTFGLRQLIEGVNDAFYPATNENIISLLNITIKK